MPGLATILPPTMRDQRGEAFAAAADASLKLDPWLACPIHVETAPDPILWELARQFDVAGPLLLGTKDRAAQERLVKNAPKLQGKKGTLWAVEEIMRILGFTDAQVTDRTGLHKYNGEISHDGAHTFDSSLNTWRSYRLRLFIGPNSRPFDEQGREDAARLAAAWAPLRSSLEAFYARHIITTKTKAPLQAAESVAKVLISNGKGNAQPAPFWLQYFPGLNKCAVHWSAPSIAVFAGAHLMDGNDKQIYYTALPPIHHAPGVTYEGMWTFEE